MTNNSDLNKKLLFTIDNNIDKLVKEIELLSYVNPVNAEEQKQLFFKSKYLTDPVFKYPEIKFDRFKLRRELFNQPIENIENEVIKELYEDTIYFYSSMIKCIQTINKGKKFYYNSLHTYGTPSQQDVDNANFILHFTEESEKEAQFLPKYTPKQAAEIFKEYSNQYSFTYNIRFSDKMSAIAMVLNNEKALVINSNHTFSENEMAILTNHEIGVHMVTTMNGLLHPLKILSHGLPNNVETQEGLAVFSEYMSGNLTIKRLKELAYRVIAVDSLAKGYSFSKTFRLLHNFYDLDIEAAFNITMRVHRGGGFTKDYLYLSGLKKVYDFYQKNDNFSQLLTGKVSLEYLNEIKLLQKMQFAVPANHETTSFRKNNNKNITVDFILKNLK